jgi:hypothetical protein
VYPFWVRDDDGGPVDAELALPDSPDLETLIAFQQQLDATLVAQLGGFAIAHAGVVEAGGCLLLLPGRSGSGKSSFVSHLVANGARYYSDEYALIDDRGRVHAYPRPVLLRDDAGRNYLDRTAVSTLTMVPPPRHPDVLLFLEHQPGAAGVSLERIDAGTAAVALLKSTPVTWAARPGLVSALALAAAPAAAYKGVRGDLDRAWRALRERLMDDGIVISSGPGL